MAKIEYTYPANEHASEFTVLLEARVWGVCGSEDQIFYVGSGVNLNASDNIWLEIRYCVNGAQIFYTRNFFHLLDRPSDDDFTFEDDVKKVLQEGHGEIGFGEIMPETSIRAVFSKYFYHGPNVEERSSPDCNLKISIDTEVVIGKSSPGNRSIDIILKEIDSEQALKFMRELFAEIIEVYQGKHPDPAHNAAGASEWPFTYQLNTAAYDKISQEYHDDYFENEILTAAFDSWLSRLPAGGKILDAGCGHGEPVISRLLAGGFDVTGSDFSPAMINKASQQFPTVNFILKPITQIDADEVYDGICSFNSVLYLDLIDFLHAVYRLHCALKPGGLLFLFGYDPGPSAKSSPFGFRVGQWMWSWHYGMDEAVSLLEEHGYFKVIDSRKVHIDENEAERMAREKAEEKKSQEMYLEQMAKNNPNPNDPLDTYIFKSTVELSPYSYIIIARRCANK